MHLYLLLNVCNLYATHMSDVSSGLRGVVNRHWRMQLTHLRRLLQQGNTG